MSEQQIFDNGVTIDASAPIKTINIGGPAFQLNWEQKGEFWAFGMTLRDYFAAKALPAIYKDTCECARVEGCLGGWRDEVAAEAYTMADAMLKARET